MIDIYAVHINEQHTEALTELLLQYVSQERKLKMNRYRRWIDAHRSVLGEVLVRIAVCHRHGASNHELKFGLDQNQKPLLLVPSGYHFNISHSGEWVVCALGSNPVGIDVERLKPMELEVAESIFTFDEHQALFGQKEDEKLSYFYKLWTLKESYIKATGKGLRIPLNSFSFNIDRDHVITFKADEGHPRAYFKQWSMDSEHVISICSLSGDERISSIRHVDYRRLTTLHSLFKDTH